MQLGDLVQHTIHRLSQVPGTATQVYAEQRIVFLIDSAFKFCRTHAFWPHLMQWYRRTLDGTTGKVTVKIPNVLEPDDLKMIFPKDSDRSLALLPASINPFRLVGTTPRWIQKLGEVDDPTNSEGKYLFRIWPFTATGDIEVLVKHNKVWDIQHLDDYMWMDDELIILHVLMTEVNSDGANQAEQANFTQQFNDRLKQLTKNNTDLPIEINPNAATSPMTWFDPAEFI